LISEAAMRAGTLIAFAVLFTLLAAAGWYAFAGLPASGEELPGDYYIALIAGALSAVLVGVVLMALLFYSSRRGYDEPPRFQRDDRRDL
jgi:Zn-dependent protease with chaperone function